MDTFFLPTMERPTYRRRYWPVRRPQYDDGYTFDAFFDVDDVADDDAWFATHAPVFYSTPQMAGSGRRSPSDRSDQRPKQQKPSSSQKGDDSGCCDCEKERKPTTSPPGMAQKRTITKPDRDPLAIKEQAKHRRLMSPWGLLFGYPTYAESPKADAKRGGAETQVRERDHRWRHTLSMPDVDPDSLRVRVVEDELIVEGQQRVRTFWSAFNVEIKQIVKVPPYVDLEKLRVTYIDGIVYLEAPSVAKDIKVVSVQNSVQKNEKNEHNANDDGIRVTPMDAVETEIDAETESAVEKEGVENTDKSSANEDKSSANSVSTETESSQIEGDSALEKTKEVPPADSDNSATDGKKQNNDRHDDTPGVTLPVINLDGSKQVVEVVRVDPVAQNPDTNLSDDVKNVENTTKIHTPTPEQNGTPSEIVESVKDTQITIEKDCSNVDVNNSERSMTKLDYGKWLIKKDIDGASVAQMALDLSYFAPDEIEARVKDNQVSVHAKHGSEKEGRRTRVERFYQYQLPSDVDVTNLRCRVTPEGVLNINIPLAQ